MVMLPTRRLLLVAFLFFCIVSSAASARSLRETRHVDEKAQQGPISAFNQKVQSQSGEQLNGDDDLVTMDYTPAKKNPPIHNEASDGIFKPKENEGNAEGKVFSMDYTPARRKPPIHN
ncbi:uncharacterized protein LOC129319767 [Prosopis cineraria]|uniref:uncharacterized protein LOC129319767 n=1 Tax=Prosopis cineraria TaxID=364024 RepID=UPI00240EDB49|nr:uncharacterized protein LOC129319767 [Prosopis cineraria]